MTPFSVLKASDGKPLRFQSRTVVCLDKNRAKENFGEQGIEKSFYYRVINKKIIAGFKKAVLCIEMGHRTATNFGR